MLISNRKQCISNSWIYRGHKEDEGTRVNLPHSNKEVPYNYFDEKIYQFISYYEKELFVGEGDRQFLVFDGVMTAFKIYVNEKFVGEYKGGYIAHPVEITDFVTKGQVNKVWVEVDSTEREDIPPFGYVVDYLTFGGIYRDVWQYNVSQTFIKNLFFKYQIIEHDGTLAQVNCMPSIEIDNRDVTKEVVITLTIDGHIEKLALEIKAGVHRYNLETFVLQDINLWNLEMPNLYACQVDMNGEKSEDNGEIKVGFREVVVEADKLSLNGNNITLFGLNRHQSYPYVGYAMPKRAQESDVIILKNELGLNSVRTSHYPQSTYFLDKCDEIGLLVLEEIPGWQYVSQREDWRNQVLKDVKGMIERDYNHPSIITWGVRINESQDDHELYAMTNKLARELDDTRPTSGVRCIERSEMLEDIYTMNDFVHDGSENILRTRERCTGLEKPVPYMVTEFCGHIYPTKKFDQEERIVEHALRHGRVQSMAAQKEEVLGAIGWCAFDYNTHFDFGSGDRICYHGVMDMFRIPKFAAATYKSQRNPELGYVIEPLTYWTRGEKNRGIVFPIHVFTNCDVIEVKLGGISKGKFSRQFHNTDPKMQYLKYPPFVLNISNGEWGAHWTDAEFIGYANEERVINRKFVANPTYADIEVIIDDESIYANQLDVTRVVVRAVDEIGNTLPYVSDGIDIKVTGDIEVVGPMRVSLIGGSIAFWVRTKVDAKVGECEVKVRANIGYEKVVKIILN
ncbi:MAG: glycoside hydrolase family 2 TIM barrel-domain containing protein [Cellulosilyticaceae bacterium]